MTVTGGTITTDGVWQIHTFTTSGTLVVPFNLECFWLVVAGGGGGGSSVAYSVGDIVAHDGVLYRCVQAHRSQDDWTPDKVPALWTPVREKAGPAPDEWKAPSGAQDAYSKGDRVSFQGGVYESLIDANTWSPVDYPAGWKAVLSR